MVMPLALACTLNVSIYVEIKEKKRREDQNAMVKKIKK
jgi:hypothetical protein